MKNDNTTQWVVIGILGFLILNKLSQGANEILSLFGANTGKNDKERLKMINDRFKGIVFKLSDLT